jgi:hypothetical protein
MWHLIILCCFQADVDRLRHPDFAVRQAAEERLTVWRDLTWPLLDRPFSDVEQRRRARRIVQATFGSNPAPLPFLAQHCYLEWYHERENGNSYPRIQAGRPLHDSQLLFLQITRKGWLDRLLDHYCVQAKEYPDGVGLSALV